MRKLLKKQGYIPDAIYNHLNLQRHLISRPILRQMRARAAADWHQIVAA